VVAESERAARRRFSKKLKSETSTRKEHFLLSFVICECVIGKMHPPLPPLPGQKSQKKKKDLMGISEREEGEEKSTSRGEKRAKRKGSSQIRKDHKTHSSTEYTRESKFSDPKL
jgi:hypothetical protein